MKLTVGWTIAALWEKQVADWRIEAMGAGYRMKRAEDGGGFRVRRHKRSRRALRLREEGVLWAVIDGVAELLSAKRADVGLDGERVAPFGPEVLVELQLI